MVTACPAVGYTATGWKNSQSASLLSGVSVVTDATSISNVGTGYSTTASGGTCRVRPPAITRSVMCRVPSRLPAPLTVTAGTGTMVYGDSVPGSLGYTVTAGRTAKPRACCPA